MVKSRYLNLDIPKKLYFQAKYGSGRLEAVEIETTTICNRKCAYCPNSKIVRPQEFMKEETFKKIIDSLSEIGFSGRISPHFYGEPLTDERLPCLLKYVREKLPNAQIKLFTNGDLLTVEKYMELSDAGVDVFRVSQHSTMQSDVIKKTLEYAKNNKGVPIEYINYNSEYFEKKNASGLMMNRGGLIKEIENSKKSTCLFVNQLTFDYEGNSVLCCNDYLSSVKFGNINQNDVNSIWNNPGYVKSRKGIIAGNFTYEICKNCS